MNENMKTSHQIHFEDAKNMVKIPDSSVALMVTSPPYPMIEMWDELFIQANPAIAKALHNHQEMTAFELMHQALDPVWQEVYRVLEPGGIACVNIGDATRTINSNFILYPNHARILNAMVGIGFAPLPQILWRKQTNAPNKFMGSGMMPPGAYVTLEHEHVLILRKGRKREFPETAAKQHRRESAFFWEERNHWFSDVWMDLKGTTQKLTDNGARQRSAAYPFELPYRLITMFSVKDDVVLDPFLGTGTTMAAAMAAGRSSVGFELSPEVVSIHNDLDTIVSVANERIENRLAAHLAFVEERMHVKGPLRYRNRYYGFPVVTNQETQLIINALVSVEKTDNTTLWANHSIEPQPDYAGLWDEFLTTFESGPVRPKKRKKKPQSPKQVQRKLLDF